jgi:Fic family protein
MASFKYHKLELIQPHFDSKLTNTVIELESLRTKTLQGSTPVQVFIQLKDLYHTLESIYSARIEGNHTTISNYITHNKEDKLTNTQSEQFKEIENIEKCLEYIESLPEIKINNEFIKNIHKIITHNLNTKLDGDSTPGEYRITDVMIGQSEHLPPFPEMLNKLMDELIDFMDHEDDTKYDLIKLAIFHHRFTWIHPFTSGNGRTVRALTYALLIKYGFLKHRIINPTAIFCKDRNQYYYELPQADKGSLENWVQYMLLGLKNELNQIDKLTNYDYTRTKILLPIIEQLDKTGNINRLQKEILISCINNSECIINSNSVKTNIESYTVAREIKKLLELGYLKSTSPRKQTINLDYIKIKSSLAYQLEKNGFLPEKVE